MSMVTYPKNSLVIHEDMYDIIFEEILKNKEKNPREKNVLNIFKEGWYVVLQEAGYRIPLKFKLTNWNEVKKELEKNRKIDKNFDKDRYKTIQENIDKDYLYYAEEDDLSNEHTIYVPAIIH